MDSFELNKILGAILGTALVTLALNITANAIFTPSKPEKPGYDIPVPKQAAPGKAGPAETEQPLEALLPSSDPKRGEATAKQCVACHTFEKGGPNRVGPNLWGVINRPRASVPGFNYSAAMKSKGGTWTYDELYKYLQKPSAMVPGTTMTFAGIPRADQRADLINYLHTLADNPPPLPTKAADSGPPGGAPQPLEALLPSSDPKRGEAVAKQCAVCHTFDKGGPNRVGPNLWGVINRPRASVPDFNYSAAMKSKGGTWTYDELYKYLQKPSAMVPGTTMTFVGIPHANQLADLINYLHTLADNPPPLPTKAADSGPPGGAPQQGAQPAQGQPANAGAQPNAQSGQAPKPQ